MIRALMLSLSLPGVVLAQWSYCSGTSGPACISSNVGIGVASPVFPLDVTGSIHSSFIFTNADTSHLTGGGYLQTGINTLEWGTDDLLLSPSYGNGNSTFAINVNYPGFIGISSIMASGGMRFAVSSSISEAMRIQTDGKVGIGTPAPCSTGSLPANCLLSVAGGIRANEVVVTSTGADYVFDRDYKLTPLSDLAAYIAANHHLPDVPSAREVEEKGVSLGEMQSKLLAKVEELTLHMIQAEKKNIQLEGRIQELQEKIRKLESGNQEK